MDTQPTTEPTDADETDSELPEPPEGCTCIWTRWLIGGSSVAGAVYIAMPDCPALPHPRRFLTNRE